MRLDMLEKNLPQKPSNNWGTRFSHLLPIQIFLPREQNLCKKLVLDKKLRIGGNSHYGKICKTSLSWLI